MKRRQATAAFAVLALAGLTVPAAHAEDSMAAAAHELLTGHVLVDRLEYRLQDGDDHVAWEAEAWYGGDYEKLWLKTEGEYARDSVEEAEVQVLYSRLVAHFWDLQAGLRHDFEPEPTRFYAVVGLQGLAPGFVEVDGQAFLSDEGDVSARLDLEHDLFITQRLVLQPAAEINVALQKVSELGVGSGINDVELGLRLRYEFSRAFAPYIGVHWQRKIGETARLAEREGEDVEATAAVFGLRVWF